MGTILCFTNVTQGLYLAIAGLLCSAATLAQVEQAQVEQLPVKPRISDTDVASCYDQTTGRLRGSEVVRSHVFVSPGGHYRAYAEIKAVASAADGNCANTSRLYVATEDQPFRQELVVEPSPESGGNSVTIVDWSPDGRTLLFAQGVFQWGTDAGVSFVRFFDAATATMSDTQLIDNSFTAHMGKSCAAVIEPLGFASDGEIALAVSPFFMMGEDQPEEDSCVRQKGAWLFDRKASTWMAVAQDYKAQRFGKHLSEAMDAAATSTRGAKPSRDPRGSPSAPEQSMRPTPPPPTTRKSPRM